MDNNKLNELKNKQNLLKEKLELNKLKERISFQINYLKDNNFEYNLYYYQENIKWILSEFPIRKRENYFGLYDDFQINIGRLFINNFIF